MRRGLVLLLFAASLAAFAGAAPAGVVSGKDRAGDVKATGLTPAERAAVDIVSERVVGASNLGVFVTVTFRGDFEHRLGKGGLARAAAVLVLKPKARSGLTSAGLVTTGAGHVGRLLRHTRSTRVGAYRHGRKLTFFVGGSGFGTVGTVAVATIARPPAASGRALADTPPYLGQRIWVRYVTLHPIDLHVVRADVSQLTCPELAALLASIDDDLDDPYFSQNVSFAVVRALHLMRTEVKHLLDKCSPPRLNAIYRWTRFSPGEVAGSGSFTGPTTTFTGVIVELPQQYGIVNQLCPSQLPNAHVSGNSITCDGGTLRTGQQFGLNLATSPPPPDGIGGELFGQTAGGATVGPFAISGP
jgi:hypothetical protein